MKMKTDLYPHKVILHYRYQKKEVFQKNTKETILILIVLTNSLLGK